jgi:hypothetical protein
MPINVNDDDLDPNMASLPESKTGCTQITFGLIRFEISNTLRKLQYVPPGPRRCNKFFSELSVEKKEQWVRELHERLENQYLKDTDMSVRINLFSLVNCGMSKWNRLVHQGTRNYVRNLK